MNERAPDLMQQVLHPEMNQKILLRAAELVAMGGRAGRPPGMPTGRRSAPRRRRPPRGASWGRWIGRCASCGASTSTPCWASRSTPTTRRRARWPSSARSAGRSNRCSAGATWRTGTTTAAPAQPPPSGYSERRPRRRPDRATAPECEDRAPRDQARGDGPTRGASRARPAGARVCRRARRSATPWPPRPLRASEVPEARNDRSPRPPSTLASSVCPVRTTARRRAGLDTSGIVNV